MKIPQPKPAVIVLLADGLRPDVLDEAIARGDVPELTALRELGGRHMITTVFPSVTGVAYIPFLTGRHPAELGVPGLRWYDRQRQLPRLIGHSRSYVGWQLFRLNDDLDARAETMFDVVNGEALGMAPMLTRGLPPRQVLDRGWWHAARIIAAHATGSVGQWAAIESAKADRLIDRIRDERPRFVFAAFTTGDKAAHKFGHESPQSLASLKQVDEVVGQIRTVLERDNRWSSTLLMVVSDHGHSPVDRHYDLAFALRAAGMKVRAHPWTTPFGADAAVMVGGNSMAHVYLDLDQRRREPRTSHGWQKRVGWLTEHPAVDLVANWTSESTIGVHKADQRAIIEFGSRGLSYRPVDGNPLGLKSFEHLSDAAIHERTLDTNYPDSVHQLCSLVTADRAGDLIISATPGWDLRRRYEPISHVSSHGALHAAHMLVPLLANQPLAFQPRRTTDVFTLTLQALSATGKSGSRAA